MVENQIGLTQEQVAELTAATPSESIQSRPAPWGGEMDYVTGEYVKMKLMTVFDGAFRVIVRNIETIEDTILTHITLEYPLIQFCANETTFVNELWGRVDEVGVSTIRQQGQGTNYATAIKASHTDALKRAATHLGIGLDLYEKTTVQEETVEAYMKQVDAKNNKQPAWVDAARQSNQPVKKAPQAKSFGSGRAASEKQVGYLKSLASRVQDGWTPEWLAEISGLPLDKCKDLTTLQSMEASSVIDILKEMSEACI